MPGNPLRRRFIAGAVCPRCARMDKIVVDLDTDQRECVACGFTEPRPGDPSAPPADAVPAPAGVGRELPTRVSRPAARRVETPAEPVRLVEPAPVKKQD
ncbi:MAG: YheV family putative metal-binding protein [Pseudomonadales bacterium]|nr:YheV family putative metal-binding protein [Halioglobus sp.]MCP5121209.1 YheV family putative metal-binding protein [Pseudomonadales bacterium]MCP5193451.1 YheV family putative metal-binding protein [Pseudomonadales bacterium]